jgi:hypothetical protein
MGILSCIEPTLSTTLSQYSTCSCNPALSYYSCCSCIACVIFVIKPRSPVFQSSMFCIFDQWIKVGRLCCPAVTSTVEGFDVLDGWIILDSLCYLHVSLDNRRRTAIEPNS